MIIACKNRDADTGFDITHELIQFYTGSPYMHVEILLEAPYNMAISARTQYDGITALPYSAAMPTYPKGWELYRVPTRESEEAIFSFLLPETGKSFNYPSLVATQGLGLRLQNPSERFCSEIAYMTVKRFATVPIPEVLPAQVNPGRMRQMLIDAGCMSVTLSQI